MAQRRKPKPAFKPRHSFGSMSRKARDRAAREGAEYGLTRRQTRERYNRGTFRPFAKEPAKRAPRNAPTKIPVSRDELIDAAIANMDMQLGDYFQYNRVAIIDALQHHAKDAALIRMASATEDELLTWASFQKRGKPNKYRKRPPSWLTEFGWYDHHGSNNIFWYH